MKTDEAHVFCHNRRYHQEKLHLGIFMRLFSLFTLLLLSSFSSLFAEEQVVKSLEEAPSLKLFGQVLKAPRESKDLGQFPYYFFKTENGKAIAIPLELNSEQKKQLRKDDKTYYHITGVLEIRHLSLEGRTQIVTVLRVTDIVPRLLSDLSYKGFSVQLNEDSPPPLNEEFAKVGFIGNSDRPVITLPDRVAVATVFIAGLFAAKELAPATGSNNSYGGINHGVLLTTSAVFLGSLLLEAMEEKERKK